MRRSPLLVLLLLVASTSLVTGLAARCEAAEPAVSLPAEVSSDGLAELKGLLEETKSLAATIRYKGQTIAEWYWNDSDADSTFETWSVSKSYASTCIGLLIDDGRIESVDDPVSKYVPSWSEGDKAAVTLRHLLEQTSGLREATGFVFSRDQLTTALDADIITPPGERCLYNNAGCNVLSAVISAAAGQDPEAYMRARLWEPLGMTHTSWRRDNAGNVITYAGIQSTAADLARFGEFILAEGQWEGQQLLSRDWIEQATTQRTEIDSVGGRKQPYGWLWWIDFESEDVPHNYSALGLLGNNLTVIPELDLVGVRLVGNYSAGGTLMRRTPEWVKLLAGVIEPAEEPVAANKTAAAQ